MRSRPFPRSGSRPGAPPAPPRRRGAWPLIALAVLAGHALVGLGVGAALERAPAGSAHAAPLPQVLQTRQIADATPAPRDAGTATPARPQPAPIDGRPGAAPGPLRAVAQSPARDPALVPAAAPAPPQAPATDMGASEPAPARDDVRTADAAPDAGFALAYVAAPAPGTPASAPEAPPPVYATKLPPAAKLEYELRRGPVGGSATLRWLPVTDHYTLSLEGGTFGFTILSQSSDGSYDRAGIAPRRFIDTRRGREARAANFQRDIGRITYSGPQIEYALLPGTQDRLSWMVQAAAIVNAAPARFVPGKTLSMFVSGARGDADVWTFDVIARETLELPAGKVAGALRLKREPRKPYDTEVEVWLDPGRHHLPVRLRLAVPQTGEATDFALRAAELR